MRTPAGQIETQAPEGEAGGDRAPDGVGVVAGAGQPPGASGETPPTVPTPPGSRWPWPASMFDPRGVPVMARANYRRELLGASMFPFVLVVFEGSVLSVLVRIGYEGRVDGTLLNSMTAFIGVIPALANLSSFIWVRLAHARHKVQAVVRVLAIMLCVALALAFLPKNEAGLVLTAAFALLARSCWAGFTTIRSTIWKSNYPDGTRGRITSRFAMIGPTLIALSALGLGEAMHYDDRAYRVVVPAGCALALVGLISWSKVRVREHRSLLRGEFDSGRATGGPSFNPLRMARVLRADRDYDRFMVCQFMIGLGNIMSLSLLAIVLRERFGVGYREGLLVTSVITLLVMPMAVPLWARIFDGMHVAKFRAIHSWIFVLSLSTILLAVRLEVFWLMYVFAVLKGIAFGGGSLGWTLGHLDFAPRDKASEYMGVHVTLTGVRGVISAIAGVALYEALEGVAPRAGDWVFAGCLGIVIVGSLGFVMLSRDLARRGRMCQHKIDDNPPQPTASGS